MSATKVWTLADLDALPDDGNRYEIVDGELLVTPAPGPAHEEIAARLAEVLVPYVAANRLGRVYMPKGVVQHQGSQVEPDLQVRQPLSFDLPWDRQPVPILVVEILSPSNRPRHQLIKRRKYTEIGVHEYWIVDRARMTFTAVSADGDAVHKTAFQWHPRGAPEPLIIDVQGLLSP